jgi:tRNA pseudouridine38-40 synthase
VTNILITVEYDGTNYHGWQIQENALTVQQKLQDALRDLLGEEIKLTGAGRTDAGVHARGQKANFRVQNLRVPLERLALAINSLLPQDIVVKDARVMDNNFHARYDAISKIYSYLVYNDKLPSAILRNYTYHYPLKLDLEAMARAACYLRGTHDFSSFKASGGSAKNFTRTIYHTDVLRKPGNLIKFEFEGNGFLYNMVRIMVGTLLEVGNGSRKPEDVMQIMSAKNRAAAGHTAPAKGLCLQEVIYPFLDTNQRL